MGKDVSQYQSVDTLIKARNALVHFKPEWHDEQEVHDKIGKRLKGKFSPFVDENSPVFPVRCMTHGFAAWAVRSSLNFVQWYSRLAGLPNRFAQFMERMNTSVDNAGITIADNRVAEVFLPQPQTPGIRIRTERFEGI
jgi:hypothetical protein